MDIGNLFTWTYFCAGQFPDGLQLIQNESTQRERERNTQSKTHFPGPSFFPTSTFAQFSRPAHATMASSTPTTHSVLTTTAHSIAQVLPAEIIEQIHKSLCAVEEDVHVGGFTRRGRRFAGVCSAWRNEALRRGEYVVNSLGQFENFVGFMEGDAASAKRAVGLNVRARFRNNADKIKRSALVKRLAALCVELSSLTLFVGEDTGSSMIRSENQPFVDGDVRTELAKLRRMKDFWMRGGKITLEQVRL